MPIEVIGVIAIIISYFVGNISPAILLGKMHGIEIKKEGSGNAGTTNVLRVLGKKAAIITLLVDILKGVVVVLLAGYFLGPVMLLACGIAVVCGHIWPAIYGFKGGKGVATTIGVVVATYPLLGLITIVTVLIVILITRRVSVGSILGALFLPLWVLFLASHSFPSIGWIILQLQMRMGATNIAHAVRFGGDINVLTALLVTWAAILGIIIIAKHHANIVRIFKGEEPKLSFKKKEPKDE